MKLSILDICAHYWQLPAVICWQGIACKSVCTLLQYLHKSAVLLFCQGPGSFFFLAFFQAEVIVEIHFLQYIYKSMHLSNHMAKTRSQGLWQKLPSGQLWYSNTRERDPGDPVFKDNARNLLNHEPNIF